jgi:hypothetical protein
MITAEKRITGVLVGLAAFVALATPLAAQARQGLTAAGRAATHECSVKAAKYKDSAAELDHLYTFRTCMYQHRVPGD